MSVSPEWVVDINGHTQTGYATEESLVLAAFSKRADTVIGVQELAEVIVATHDAARELGAKSLPVVDMRPNKFLGEGLRLPRVKGIVDRLLRPRLGPVSSSLYHFRTQPMSYLLCTDITDEAYGLQIIEEQSGKFVAEHGHYFKAQHARRLREEARWVGAFGGAPVPRDQLTEKDSKQPAPEQPRPADTQTLVKERVLSILESPAGIRFGSGTLRNELVDSGFSRAEAEKFLRTLDGFVRPGYLVKVVDPDNKNDAIYIRTTEDLRRK